MQRNNVSPSRRTVLKGLGAGTAAVAGTGLASAAPTDTVEVNIGFSAESGKQAALSKADSVVQEFNQLDIVTLQLPKQAADALANRADVRYVEENGIMRKLGEVKWGVDRVDAEVSDNNGYTGAGVDVAIIDTGIDSDHPDLQANIGQGHAVLECGASCQCPFWYCGGGNSNTCNETWDDDNDHGTHCAGIAGAIDNGSQVQGVAPEITLHAIKVLGASGCGSTSDIARGIEIAGEQGYDVGSMSLGGSDSTALKDACEYASNQGVELVAAAGNDGSCTDCVGYPAAYPEVMAVSSTNSDDQLSSFSSQGPQIEIAAPGTDIPSTTPAGVETFSGTSMACPHVAGGVAVAKAAGYSDGRQRLKNTAENIGLSDNESGAGLLDVAAAVGLDSSDDR